jgi:hypothetical protein
VGPRVVPSNVAVGGAHLGIGSTLGGGEKAVAHRCFEAAAGSSSLSRRWGSLTLQR